MSARDLSGPSNALVRMINSFQARIQALERRVRWPGATQFNKTTSVNIPDDSPTYHEVATLTLDPGAWMLLGGSNMEMDAGATPGGYIVYVRITPTTSYGTPESVASGLLNSSNATTESIAVQGFTTISTQTTYSLEVRYFTYIGSTPDGTALDSYLLAFPA